MNMIPLASIQRISKKAGVQRISAKALKELQNALEDIGIEIARDAAELARHAHRKTMLKEDILLASKKM
ncbi:MAG: histone family protein [Candidatus Aenigmarchaeota archaeon]|nr:histone family protein [Candidatus Aenigmarchaeota archaeon]